VRAFFPASAARGAYAGSFSAFANLMLYGHTSWDVWRYAHFEIRLGTGARTLAQSPRNWLMHSHLERDAALVEAVPDERKRRPVTGCCPRGTGAYSSRSR
jgi:hypothetical protein